MENDSFVILILKGLNLMKYTLYLSAIILLSSFLDSASQQNQSNPAPYRPMTKVESRMLLMVDLNEVKQAYDTIKTDYERRYFIRALPRYFAEKKITVIPDWVNSTVHNALSSNDSWIANDAIFAAGRLKLNCARDLVELFKILPQKHSGQVVLLGCSIIRSLVNISDTNTSMYLNDILTSCPMPPLGERLGTMLDVMQLFPSDAYNEKLNEYAASLSAQLAQLTAKTDSLDNYKEMAIRERLGRIEIVQKRMAYEMGLNAKNGRQQ